MIIVITIACFVKAVDVQIGESYVTSQEAQLETLSLQGRQLYFKLCLLKDHTAGLKQTS